jgi:hypothetical protein
MNQIRIISGHVMYMGPRIQHLGLGYSALFRNGIHPTFYPAIEQCPAIGELFIPVADIGKVRRELNFDYAHNMKGTTGRHVTFYREIQKWIAQVTQQKPQPSGITLETHHA